MSFDNLIYSFKFLEFEPESGRKLITNDALKGKNRRLSNDEKSELKEQEIVLFFNKHKSLQLILFT